MSDDRTPVQRVRVSFAEGEALKYISHLDLTRTWERIFRRALLPVAYSQGFNPRPRFQIAAALPVGVTGRAELVDIWLVEAMEPNDVHTRLQPAVPAGLEVLGVEEVALGAASLQSQMVAADYTASITTDEPAEGIETRVQALLNAPTIPRQRQHKGRMRSYDLRPLIQTVEVQPVGKGRIHLVMRLQSSPQGAGRPDEVLDALGLSVAPHTLERTNLCFEFDK